MCTLREPPFLARLEHAQAGFFNVGVGFILCSQRCHPLTVQLAGRGFYLPSPRAVAAGGYGAMPAVSAAGPEAGALLVEETLAMIEDVYGSA